MLTVDQALALAARGLSIIPIPAGAKIPAITWAEYQIRRATEDEIRAWPWPCNAAIVCGAVSGVVAVDCDDEAALRYATRHLLYTPWQQRTGGGGWHLLYRHPGCEVRNRARVLTAAGRLRLDLRGDGGFIIAPGSTHPSGSIYRMSGDWDAPADSLPTFDPDWFAAPVQDARPARQAPRLGRPVIDRARAYLAAIPRPEIGAGSDAATLYAACRLVRGFRLDMGTAADLIWEWAGGRPGWDRGWIARKVQHAERYGTEAIGALAS